MNNKNAVNHGECLNEECLTDYLGGSLDPVVKSAYEAHLVVCDQCRESLALFMRVLSENIAPEEEIAVQQLGKIWDSRNLRPVPGSRWKVRRLASFIACIAALFAGAFFVGRFSLRSQPSPATQAAEVLVATMRPFQARVVGQPYLAIQESTRSLADPVPDVLAPEMTETSTESYEIGRYFLLRKEYGKAIRHLKTAVADPKGVPADVHNDLGVAYLQNGLENLRDQGPLLANAEGEFKEALRGNPKHKAALFNLSILYSRLGRVDEMKRRKQQYLALDPDSGWAKEIRKGLAAEFSQP